MATKKDDPRNNTKTNEYYVPSDKEKAASIPGPRLNLIEVSVPLSPGLPTRHVLELLRGKRIDRES